MYTFSLRGKVAIELPESELVASDEFVFKADIFEHMLLENKFDTIISLPLDVPVPVNLGGLTEAHLILMKVVTPLAGKVLVELTHADGALQIIPFDPTFFLLSASSPVTAISLLRSSSLTVHVEILLGELAP